MQQITKELPNGAILFVEVPDDAERFKVFNDLDKPYLSYFVGVETYRDYLPKGNWQLLVDSKSLTEEQLKEIMPIEEDYFMHYKNGQEINYIFKTALESYNSLKESLGVVDANSYGDEPTLSNIVCKSWGLVVFKKEYAKWQQAQQQVKSYQVLYKKN